MADFPTKRAQGNLQASSSTHSGYGRHGFTVRPLRGTLPLPSFGPSPARPCRIEKPSVNFVPGTKLTRWYCLHAVYMQVRTVNSLSEKEAISCQARICVCCRGKARWNTSPWTGKGGNAFAFQGLPWGISQRSESSGTITMVPLPSECRERKVKYLVP